MNDAVGQSKVTDQPEPEHLRAQINRLTGENAALVQALRPFAAQAEDELPTTTNMEVRKRHILAARAALGGTTEPKTWMEIWREKERRPAPQTPEPTETGGTK